MPLTISEDRSIFVQLATKLLIRLKNQLKQLNLWMPVIILTSVIFGGVMWVIYSITITAVILAVINLIKKLLNKKL